MAQPAGDLAGLGAPCSARATASKSNVRQALEIWQKRIDPNHYKVATYTAHAFTRL